jgi:hypothetical protein
MVGAAHKLRVPPAGWLDLRTKMLLRVVFRALVLTVAVLGLSLAFAWVWDRAEPRTSPPLGAPSAHPPSPR